MRLGSKLFDVPREPGAWIDALRAKGLTATYCPLEPGVEAETVTAYRQAAEAADVVIAEVGAWSNPLDADPDRRTAARAHCIASLALADAIGARCCVNVAGSRGASWAGPAAENLTEETFDLIVATVQEIIDAVQPDRAVYALETMPWMFPDSVACYAQLVEAIDRPGFGVHFDPVNLVNSPQRYFGNGELIRTFVARLGPQIRSVHLKDILLHDRLTVHLDEVSPGQGGLALDVLLHELNHLHPDLPVMLEHLPDAAAYDVALTDVRRAAKALGIEL